MPRPMNRKKRLDAPSKQEARERYENARKESGGGEAKSGEDNVSAGAEVKYKSNLFFLRNSLRLMYDKYTL